MIDNIKPTIGAIVALFSAWFGSVADWVVTTLRIPQFIMSPALGMIQTDIMLQRIVWTIGILAGIVSIVNGCKNWGIWHMKKKKQGRRK